MVQYFFSNKTKVYPFQDNAKDLDLFCKTDLDLWHCFGMGKTHFKAELHKTYQCIDDNYGRDKVPLITE